LGVYGTDRYLDAGNLLRHALDITPDVAYAYIPLITLAYINADTTQAADWLRQAKAHLNTGQTSQHLLDTAFGELPTPNLYNYTSQALVHVVNADWAEAVTTLEPILAQTNAATIENYLLLGLAQCNLGDYAAAEATYTTGLEKGAPTLDLLLLLRADVRRAQGNTADADADIALARSIPGRNPSQWQALVDDFESGNRTCRNLFDAAQN
jgi:tetratricopeptide (TPR) repeat protein